MREGLNRGSGMTRTCSSGNGSGSQESTKSMRSVWPTWSRMSSRLTVAKPSREALTV